MVSFFSEETLCTLQTNRLSTGQFSVSVSSNGIKLRNAMEQKQILWSVEYTVVTSQQWFKDQNIFFYFMVSRNLIPLLETETPNFPVLTLLVCKVQKV